MASGKAPVAPKSEHYNEKVIRDELHHEIEIAKGGAVYDVDNLFVNTPKNHKKIHSRK